MLFSSSHHHCTQNADNMLQQGMGRNSASHYYFAKVLRTFCREYFQKHCYKIQLKNMQKYTPKPYTHLLFCCTYVFSHAYRTDEQTRAIYIQGEHFGRCAKIFSLPPINQQLAVVIQTFIIFLFVLRSFVHARTKVTISYI